MLGITFKQHYSFKRRPFIKKKKSLDENRPTILGHCNPLTPNMNSSFEIPKILILLGVIYEILFFLTHPSFTFIMRLEIKLEFKNLWKVDQVLSFGQRSLLSLLQSADCCNGTVTTHFFLRQCLLTWNGHYCMQVPHRCLFCVPPSQLRWCSDPHMFLLSLLPLLDSLLKKIPSFQYL